MVVEVVVVVVVVEVVEVMVEVVEVANLQHGPGGFEDGAPALVPGARPRRRRLEGQGVVRVHPRLTPL